MFTLILFCIFPWSFLFSSGASTQFRVMTSPYGTLGSHPLDPSQSVGFLRTSDQPEAETSPWKHTTLSRDRLPCSRRDSKPQSQQASGCRRTPWTARSLGSAFLLRYQEIFSYLGIYSAKRQVPRLSPHNRHMWSEDNCWCLLWDNGGKYRRAGEATEGNMTHAQCMLDN